jgi:uncharacterized protein YndB with AHSA1/START domain
MSTDAHAIVTSRVLPAARERVWAAFSDPVALAGWWGPVGFTNTFHAFDFHPGGAWRFTMHGPDGAAYAMDKVFTEIAAPERIVLRHFQQGHDFTLTITLAAQGDRTRVTWHMLFADAVEAAKLRSFLVVANEQNLDRLAAYLSGKPPVVR